MPNLSYQQKALEAGSLIEKLEENRRLSEKHKEETRKLREEARELKEKLEREKLRLEKEREELKQKYSMLALEELEKTKSW